MDIRNLPVHRAIWRPSPAWMLMTALLMLGLLAKAPSAHACACLADPGQSAETGRIERADLAFIGKLTEIHHVPRPQESLWDKLGKGGWHAWVDVVMAAFREPPYQTEYVFETVSSIKGEPSRRHTVVDASMDAPDCDRGPPNYTGDIGKTIRVLAYRPASKETPAKPDQPYLVRFSFCGGSFRII
jgi:hypothetical protein